MIEPLWRHPPLYKDKPLLSLIPTRRMFDLIPIMQMKTSLNITAESPQSGCTPGTYSSLPLHVQGWGDRWALDRHCISNKSQETTATTNQPSVRSYIHIKLYTVAFFSRSSRIITTSVPRNKRDGLLTQIKVDSSRPLWLCKVKLMDNGQFLLNRIVGLMEQIKEERARPQTTL